jgi:hypothetical protein
MNYLVNSFPATVTVELSVATSNLNATFEWYAFNQGPFSGVQTTEGNERISKFVKDFTIDEAIKSNGYCKLIAPNKAFIFSNPVELNAGIDAPLITISESITADSSGIISISVPYPEQEGPFYGDWQYSTTEPAGIWTTIPNQEKYVIGQPFTLKKNFSELSGYTYIRFVISTSVDSEASNECKLYDFPAERPTISISGPNQSGNLYLESDITGLENLIATASPGATIEWFNGDNALPEDQLTKIGEGASIQLKFEDGYKKIIVAKATNSEGSTFSNKITVLYDNNPVITSVNPSNYRIIPDENGAYTSSINFENAETLQLQRYNSFLKTWVNYKEEIDVAAVTSYSLQDNISNFEFSRTQIRYKLTNINGDSYSKTFVTTPSYSSPPEFVIQPQNIGLVTENITDVYNFTVSAINSFGLFWETTQNVTTGPWFTIADGTNTLSVPISTIRGDTLRWYRARAYNYNESNNQRLATSEPVSLGISAPPLIWGITDAIPQSNSEFEFTVYHLRGSNIEWQTRPNSNTTQWTTLSSYNIERLYNPKFRGIANDYTTSSEFRCIVTNSLASLTSNTVQLDLEYSNDVPNNGNQQDVNVTLPIYYSGGVPITLTTDVTNAQSITWQYRVKKANESNYSAWTSLGFKRTIEVAASFYNDLAAGSVLEFQCIAGNEYGSTFVKKITATIIESYVTIYSLLNYSELLTHWDGSSQNLKTDVGSSVVYFEFGNNHVTSTYINNDKIPFPTITNNDIAVFGLGGVQLSYVPHPSVRSPSRIVSEINTSLNENFVGDPYYQKQKLSGLLARYDYVKNPEFITWQGSLDGLEWTDMYTSSALNYLYPAPEQNDLSKLWNDYFPNNRFPTNKEIYDVAYYFDLNQSTSTLWTDLTSIFLRNAGNNLDASQARTSVYDFYGNYKWESVSGLGYVWLPEMNEINQFKYLRFKFLPSLESIAPELDPTLNPNYNLDVNPNSVHPTPKALSGLFSREFYSTPINVVQNKNSRIPKLKQQPLNAPITINISRNQNSPFYVQGNSYYSEIPRITQLNELLNLENMTWTSPEINLRAVFSNPQLPLIVNQVNDIVSYSVGWEVSSKNFDYSTRPNSSTYPQSYSGGIAKDVSFTHSVTSVPTGLPLSYDVTKQEDREIFVPAVFHTGISYSERAYRESFASPHFLFKHSLYSNFKIRPIAYNMYGIAAGNWIDFNINVECDCSPITRRSNETNVLRLGVHSVTTNARKQMLMLNSYYISEAYAEYVPLSGQWQINNNPNDVNNDWTNIGTVIATSAVLVEPYIRTVGRRCLFNITNGIAENSPFEVLSEQFGNELDKNEVSLLFINSTNTAYNNLSAGGSLNPNGTLSVRFKYWDELYPAKYTPVFTIT